MSYSLKRKKSTTAHRPKIMISDAERRRIQMGETINDMQARIKDLLPWPQEREFRAKHHSQLFDTKSARTGADAGTASLDTLRSSLYAGADPQSGQEPAGLSMPLTCASTVMNLILLFTALPVGVTVSLIAIFRGNDFRLTAHALAVSGLVLTGLGGISGTGI